MAASKSFEVTFTKDRETKGTFRYAEDESPERAVHRFAVCPQVCSCESGHARKDYGRS
jgi:hypothetical protein